LVTQIVLFSVTVQDSCLSTIISNTAITSADYNISPTTMSEVQYFIGITPLLSLNFIDWAESLGICGLITYSLSVDPFTSVISLSSKTITIFSIDQADFGDY
jgi:hypothetical protein